MNRVILTGNLGKDPELKQLQNSTVCNCSLATTEIWGDKKETQWHNIVFWNKAAEFVAQWCKKGDKILVEGEIKYEKYTGKDGVEKTATKINAIRVEKLSWEKSEIEEGPKKVKVENKKTVNKYDPDDDLPF